MPLRVSAEDSDRLVRSTADDITSLLAHCNAPDTDSRVCDRLNALSIAEYPHGPVFARADDVAVGRDGNTVDVCFMPVQLAHRRTVQRPKTDDLIVSSRSKRSARPVTLWDLAEASRDVRVAFNGAQKFAVDVEHSDVLVGTCGEHKLLVVDQDSPDGHAVAEELSNDLACLDIPHEDLTVPTARDELAAIFAESQAADRVCVLWKNAIRIRVRGGPGLLDVDDGLFATGSDQTIGVFLGWLGDSQRIEPVRCLHCDRVVVQRRLW